MLKNLIDSYRKLSIPNNISACLLIVENDTSNFCEDLVKNESTLPDQKIYYQWEPNLGIPFARNACLNWALKQQQTHIAFVDDDEFFDELWLREIWNYYISQPPLCAIQGKVIPVFPEGTRQYLQSFYQPNLGSTGTLLEMCATNNVLVPLSFIADKKLQFDTTSPLEGGSDSIFFREAKSLGLSLIYCSNAIVYEEIPRSRATIKWLSKRHFRIGIGAAKRNAKPSGLSRIKFMIFSLPTLVLRTLKALLQLAFIRKEKALKNWLKVCNRTGQIFGSLGLHVKSYKKIDGY